MWSNRVIPVREELMRMVADHCAFRCCQLHLGRVHAAIQAGRTAKALRRAGRTDKLQYRFVTHEWLAGPVGADQIKHAMLNRVPLRGTRWEVGHRNAELEGIGQPLQSDLPAPASITLGAAAIGLDQQLLGCSVAPP